MKVNIGGVIRSYRLEKEMTQKEVAAELGISSNYLCQIETGYFKPGIILLSRLAKYYRIPFPEIMVEGFGIKGKLTKGQSSKMNLYLEMLLLYLMAGKKKSQLYRTKSLGRQVKKHAEQSFAIQRAGRRVRA